MKETIDFSLISGEIFLLAAICVVLLVDLFQRDKERALTYTLTQLSLVFLFFSGFSEINRIPEIAFSGHWISDPLSVILKMAICLVSVVALMYARPYIAQRKLMRGEYYLLTLFAVLGMMVMVSANSLLMIYLGLELLSLSLYAMVALQRDSKVAAESAVKYFVMGGLASGFLLYGISLVYGTMGTIIISDIAAALKANEATLVTQFGLVFLVIGLAFKFGAVPFHMWLPDIYHGAPSSTTAYIASAPKIAAFGMAIRILDETFALYAKDWSQMILILGLLSVAFGNVVAVAQHNFKRMLAYSAIAHIGYFLLAIVVHNDAGYAAAMYYIIVYAVMTLAGFGIVIFLSTTGEDYDNISDLKGMGEHHPWYALLFSFVMVSMAGIPPFIGFWPKLEIFRVLLDAGLVFEAVVAIAFSVVGLFYYLRVIKEMYFTQTDNRPKIATSRSMKIALSLNCLLLLVLGLTPDSVYQYCLQAFSG